MTRRVTLPGGLRAEMIAHARAEAPNECCGLLIGRGEVIDDCVRVRNVDPSPTTRYLVDPAAHVATLRRLRATGRDVIGSYHSHPASPAVPSETDLAEAHYQEFVWIIVSLSDPEEPDVAAYVVRNGRFSPLAIAVTA